MRKPPGVVLPPLAPYASWKWPPNETSLISLRLLAHLAATTFYMDEALVQDLLARDATRRRQGS